MPFIVSNVDTSTNRPTAYSVSLDGGAAVDSPAQTVTGGVRLHYDVSSVSNGTHTVSVRSVIVSPEWGRLESAAVPFDFAKPASPAVPAGVKLEV